MSRPAPTQPPVVEEPVVEPVEEPVVEPVVEPEPEWTLGEGDHVGTLWASRPRGRDAFNRECSCGDFEGAPVSTVEQADEDFAEHL